MYIYTKPMNAPLTPQSLIEQILQIQRMEHGSLSIIRQGPSGPYYSLNSWEKGKNRCRYLPKTKSRRSNKPLRVTANTSNSPSNTLSRLSSKPAPS